MSREITITSDFRYDHAGYLLFTTFDHTGRARSVRVGMIKCDVPAELHAAARLITTVLGDDKPGEVTLTSVLAHRVRDAVLKVEADACVVIRESMAALEQMQTGAPAEASI